MDYLCAKSTGISMILCSNPLAQYLSQKAQIDAAIRRVLDSGRYVLGPEVQAFEEEFARYLGVSFGIGVGSGTEAIHLALAACGLKTGDEVITVSHTAVATVAAIELAGGSPVFVDIDPVSYGLDASQLEKAITSKTRVIMPVHLYGQPADLDAIMNIATALSTPGDRGLCPGARGLVSGQEGRIVGRHGLFQFLPDQESGGTRVMAVW